ncbi:hypothetical protein HIM_05889 [Hirsutella minnesotensis 3608]|uniref:Peptidase M43 pregnancy-associated plasma-A domain-containing protein n=1 Tax=Hirsutella minnesotensis 3608 TaxID=1043627 RepID=A0A0F7ZZT8_9HYPO|nr:hypothetical protein HIM_05889 [Hirsutella minnesotensis 3608]
MLPCTLNCFLWFLAAPVLGASPRALFGRQDAPQGSESLDPFQDLLQTIPPPPESSAPQDLTCGTSEPPPSLLAANQQLAASNNLTRRAAAPPPPRTNIDVYMHIIAASETSPENLNDATIKKQMDVLNDNFKSTAFSFTLRGTDRTFDKKLADLMLAKELETVNVPPEILDMKKKLRKGGFSAINIYVTKLDSVGGAATLPNYLSDISKNGYILDGINMNAKAFPGGDYKAGPSLMNEGKALTHEVGHWFGLVHTFQGGCGGEGDTIDDTPPQEKPSEGCPVGKRSCGNKVEDAVHNFMDYSSDSCRTEFSPGQIARLFQLWDRYRRPGRDCGEKAHTEAACGALGYCQLYDAQSIPNDKRFQTTTDCLKTMIPDLHCNYFDKDPKACNLGLPEVFCSLYDSPDPKFRRTDNKFKNTADCLAASAKSCDAYDQPKKPDNTFTSAKECLAARVPTTLCSAYDTNPPDHVFLNNGDCLAAHLPYISCLFYGGYMKRAKPDGRFKGLFECVEARQTDFGAIPKPALTPNKFDKNGKPITP